MEDKKASRGNAFVSYVIGRCKADKGLAAALRRADNPATEYQSWEFLIGFHVDVQKDWERLPFAAIAAAVTRSKQEIDGSTPFMSALAQAYPDSSEGPAASRLRRLLACDSVVECCSVLRPMFALVLSKGQSKVNFGALLDDLLQFGLNSKRVKARWAMDFYRKGSQS